MKPDYGPLEEEIHFGNHYFEVPRFIFFLGGIYFEGKLLVKIPASSALTLSFRFEVWRLALSESQENSEIMQTPQRIASNYPKVLESYEKKRKKQKGYRKKYDWKSTKHSNQQRKAAKQKQTLQWFCGPHLCIGFRFPPRWAWTTARHRGSGASETACQRDDDPMIQCNTSITSLLQFYINMYIYCTYIYKIWYQYIL